MANNKISRADDKDISRPNDKPDSAKKSDNSLLKDNLRNNIISTDQPWQSVRATTTPPIEKYGSGNYSEVHQTEFMRYINADGSWYVGKIAENTLQWTKVGDTRGSDSTNEFGDLLSSSHILMVHKGANGVKDGRFSFSHIQLSVSHILMLHKGAADYDKDERSDVLFHYTRDANWFLGKIIVPAPGGWILRWRKVGNTNSGNTKFGNLLDGKHMNAFGPWHAHRQYGVLFHHVRDGNWYLGELDTNTNLMWKYLGNTKGMFGDIDTDLHLIIAGSFLQPNVGSLIMYYATSANWHLGWIEDPTPGTSKIQWNHVAKRHFANLNDGKHLIMRGNFDGDPDGRDKILIYYYDGRWWFGWIEGYGYSSVMQWMPHPVGRTPGFGSLTDGHHLNVSGDFDGDGRDEILMYSSSDGDWWLIKINGTRGPPPSYFLKTIKIGKAIKIGNLADPFHEVIPDKFVRVTGQTPQSELLAIRYGNPTRKVWQITVTLSLVSIKQLRERF